MGANPIIGATKCVEPIQKLHHPIFEKSQREHKILIINFLLMTPLQPY
jgi:hypothetical protein